MSVHALYLQNRLQHGNAISGPLMLGGGFWSSLKKGAAAMATNVLGKAKQLAVSVAPIITDQLKSAGKSALNSVLTSDGSIKDRLQAGLQSGLQSVDRSALQQKLLDAARPVF